MGNNSLVYYLPDGMSPDDIEKVLPELEYSLGKHIEIETKGKAVILNLYEKELPGEVEYKLIQYPKMLLPVQVGLSRKKMEVFDMSHDGHVYMLVTGPQGTGKSTALNGILNTLLSQDHMSPALLNLYPVDLKMGNELGYLADSPYTAMTCFDPETKDLDIMIETLRQEVRHRMDLFTQHKVKKIAQYNKLKGVEKLPYMLLVIDEYAEVQQMGKEIEPKLMRLMMIGRAAGLRVIICCLRAVADVLNSNIKSLLLDRLVFAQVDKINSRVAMDVGGAEKLPKIAGRGILASGPDLTEVQVANYQEPGES